MRTIFILALLMTFNFNNAQTKPINPNTEKLDLVTLKKDIETQNRLFDVTISMVALTKSYKTTFPLAGYALEQDIYWEQSTKAQGYFRTNANIKRSKTFTQNNNFEVLIYPTLRDKSKIGRVKITWKSDGLGLNTFHLENANVSYHTEGILINGTKNIKGYPMGVTIVICSKKK